MGIKRDGEGRIVLIETPHVTMRLSRTGAWYFVFDTEDGGEIRGRFDQPELGVSAWHRPPERPIEPVKPSEPLPNNILQWKGKK